jgi:hypothetical protein
MDSLKKAVEKGVVSPLPDHAVSDPELLALSLRSPLVGEGFKNGLLKYIREKRIDVERLREALEHTMALQDKEWSGLFEHVSQTALYETKVLEKKAVRDAFLIGLMAWYGPIGGAVGGSVGSVVAALLAGYAAHQFLNLRDRVQAVQSCREYCALLLSTLPPKN